MRFLGRRLTVQEQRGLCVVLGELFRLAANFVVRDGLGEGHEACGAGLKRASTRQGIRFVSHASAIERLTMHAIALVVVHRGQR